MHALFNLHIIHTFIHACTDNNYESNHGNNKYLLHSFFFFVLQLVLHTHIIYEAVVTKM